MGQERAVCGTEGFERQIKRHQDDLLMLLDGAYQELLNSMSEFQKQWDAIGYLSIASSGQEGLFSGVASWFKGQADIFEVTFWENLGSSIKEYSGKAVDFAADYAGDVYNELQERVEWAENNNEMLANWSWWSKQAEDAIEETKETAQQKVDNAAEFLGTTKETIEKLYKHREAILNLPEHIADGDHYKIAGFVDKVLQDLDDELAKKIKNNPDYDTVLATINDHTTALTYFAYMALFVDAVPPNFYAYIGGKGGGYIASYGSIVGLKPSFPYSWYWKYQGNQLIESFGEF